MNHQVGNLLRNVTQGIILQQVNCQNAMGSGFAKAVYEKWPVVKSDFHHFSNTKQKDKDRLGAMQVVTVEDGLFVVNLFAQLNYGRADDYRYTSYDALDIALEKTAKWMKSSGLDLRSIDVHHPAIGCGLGGAHWPIVAEIIEHRIGPRTTLWTLD